MTARILVIEDNPVERQKSKSVLEWGGTHCSKSTTPRTCRAGSGSLLRVPVGALTRMSRS